MNFSAFVDTAQNGGIGAAIQALQGSGTPQEVADRFDAFLREAYWKRKDIVMVAALASEGMAYCRRECACESDPARRDQLASMEKVLAYNLASFVWPGWDEAEITLSPQLVAQGLVAARRNLELAIELRKPLQRVRDAHWLVGAHLLAAPHAGHLEEALAQFRQAVDLMISADTKDDYSLLGPGYVLLAERLLCREGAAVAWQSYLSGLAASGTEFAKEAHAQLTTAGRVFLSGPSLG